MKIQFFGAAQSVTGSKHLITTALGKKILLDCGLFQGIDTHDKNQTFGFEPSEVDYVILSHAHIDHTGLLPRLVSKGFTGPIYCTSATKDLAELLLSDSARIQTVDLERVNKRRIKQEKEPLEQLYDEDDVVQTLSQMIAVNYGERFAICPEVECVLLDAAHILGSASVNLTIKDTKRTIAFTFTGDIGRPGDKILKNPVPFPQADYIICESTYGDRLHSPAIDVKKRLLEIVDQICVKQQGKIIIPAFSVGRTQEIVYALDQLEEEGLLPTIPVYVDSPMSVKATDVMRKHKECFNQDLLKYLHLGDGDAFGFDKLSYISATEDSKALNDRQGPAIIISASGMAEAGRIKHHIANNVTSEKNAILFVGYCSPDGLGGQLKAGQKQVTIFGQEYEVKAQTFVMDSFSAHGDYEEMTQYLSCQEPQKVQKMFLVHGDVEAQTAFKAHLNKVGFANVETPAFAQAFELE